MRNYAGRIAALLAVLVVLVAIGVWNRLADEPPNEHTASRSLVQRLFGWGVKRSGLESDFLSVPPPLRSRKPTAGNAPAETPKPDYSAGLAGRVKNELGQPVADARITVRATASGFDKTVTTNKDGAFRMDGIPPGTNDILCVHPKFVTLIRPNFTFQTATVAEADFVLPLGATIKGEVVDEEQKPLADAQIRARRRKMEMLTGGGNVFLDDATYKTRPSGKDGKFQVEGVALGENVFDVHKPGYELLSQVILVEPDKAANPVKFILKKTGKIAGRVLNEDSQPVANVAVTLIRYKPFGGESHPIEPGKYKVATNEDGRFEFTKLFNEGFYDLQLEHEAYALGVVPLVAVGSDQVACVLEKGGTIEGVAQFIDQATTPAVVQIAVESVIKDTTVTRRALPDGSGAFRFEHLPYGTYRIFADQSGFVSEPKDGLKVGRNESPKDLVVDIYRATRVEGRVVSAEDQQGIAGATVTIEATYGTDKRRNRKFQSKSDQHGQFQFDRLPGGLHVAVADAKGFVKTATGTSAQTFSVEPGERKSDVVLRLYRGGTVEGVVRDANGQTVPGAKVQLYMAPTMATRRVDVKNLNATTDANGYFRIAGIDVGERIQFYASAVKAGWAKSRSRIIDLTAEQPSATTEINLVAGATISGKVTDLADFPIPGTEVRYESFEFPGDPSSSETIVHTAPDGTYMLTGCPPGNAALKVSRSGYVEQIRRIATMDRKSRAGEDFKLQSGLTITGRVVTLKGKPIPNARVQAFGIEGAAGRDQAMTDSEGNFRLANLGQGRFRLQADFKLSTPDGEQQYRFELAAVKSGQQGVELECDVDNTASGVVESEARKRINDFTVVLRSRTDLSPRQTFEFNLQRSSKSTGGLLRLVNVPRGVYSLEVAASGYEPFRDNNVYLGPGTRTELPTIRLRAAGGITGTVLSSSNRRPVNGVRVRVFEQPKKQETKGAALATVTTDYAGRFKINSIGQGTYRLDMDHPAYEPAKLDGVRVSRRSSTDVGEVFLEAGGTIQGSVTDEYGDPVPGITVLVSGLMPDKTVTTDAAGNFLIQGVRPGPWPIVAKGTLRNRRVYTFTNVVVEAERSQTVDFRLELTATLDGLVTTRDAGVVRSGRVQIHPFDENANVLEDVHYDATISAHRYAISAVPPGNYLLWASGLGMAGTYKLWQSIYLNRGQNTENLTVSGGAISGRVVGAGGEGVASVQMQLRPIFSGLRLPQSLYNSLISVVYTNRNGEFVFPYLGAGTFQMLYLDPVRLPGGQWVAQPPVYVGPDQIVGGNIIRVGN
ncbi:MAG: carboxypeptidase-like regulatory domain-containing protein [Candidatus Sumerlaeaceae bacterium]|nr:carboxypeptidase-like regulatory domain-containing protein [Candidatus Sumerlaeaceae bacterium]